MCSPPVGKVVGPNSARFPSSPIGGEIPTDARLPADCR